VPVKVVSIRGGPLAKIKIKQGEQKEKKIRAPKMFEKKFVQRLFNRENYKLKKKKIRARDYV
jgi:predicted DNA-binding antitoxin AbrB/MazE fold protein